MRHLSHRLLSRARWLAMLLALGTAIGAQAGNAEQWLRALNAATLQHSYAGTMVISVGDQMATAEVVHVVTDGRSADRIDVLTGEPRTTYRLGDEVVTVWPQQRRAVREQRADLGLFAGLGVQGAAAIDAHYELQHLPDDRIAGRAAQVVALHPRDDARWAYRIWRDTASGLMLKVQTLAVDGATVLEQSAFTRFDAGIDPATQPWLKQLPVPAGFARTEVNMRSLDPAESTIALLPPVPGFVLQRVQMLADQPRPDADHPLQWVFSDGLASLSVFYQPMAQVAPQSVAERVIRMGATHTLMRQTPQMRVTVVGEAPVATLRAFADALVIKDSAAH